MKRRNFLQSTLMVAGAAIVGTPLLTKAEPIYDPNVEIELTFYLEYLTTASSILAHKNTRVVYITDTQLIIGETVDDKFCTKEFRFVDKEHRNLFISRLIPCERPSEREFRNKYKDPNIQQLFGSGVMDKSWVHELQCMLKEYPDYKGQIEYIGPQVIRWCYRGTYGHVYTSPTRNEVYNVPSSKNVTTTLFKGSVLLTEDISQL